MRSSTSDEYLDICASIGPTLLGYAAVDRSNSPDYPAVEMAVDGAGRALRVDGELLDRALQKADGRLELWAHGRTASAARLAQSRGFIKSRELFRMRRSLREALPDALILDSIAIRPFEASTDVEAWLELNRRAFVDLPTKANGPSRIYGCGYQRTGSIPTDSCSHTRSTPMGQKVPSWDFTGRRSTSIPASQVTRISQ